MGFPRILALPALALILSASGRAQGTPSVGMPELLHRVRQATLKAAGERKVRLGVATFQPDEAQRAMDRGFSGYLTEQVFAGLGSAGPGVRLFERARLDAVLREQKLTSSGLFDESQARRIGELAPIDLLLTGTWIRLEGGVALHGRILDVVSGEVVGTFAETLVLSRELAGLFAMAPEREARTQAAPTSPETDPCTQARAGIQPLLRDLRTPVQVQTLVDEVMKVPFQGPCGILHGEVMAQLVRHKLPSASYARYLATQMAGIQDPDQDRRTGVLLAFLKSQGPLEDRTWAQVAELAARSQRPRAYLDDLLAEPTLEGEALGRIRARSEALLKMAAEGRIGRPIAMSRESAAMAILQALESLYLHGYRTGGAEAGPVLAFIRREGSRIPPGDGDMLKALESLLRALKAPGEREEVLVWYGQRLAAFPSGREVPDHLNSFLQPIFREQRRLQEAGKPTTALDRELSVFVRATGPRLAASLATFPDRETRIELTRLCVKEGRQDPGLPSLETLREQLGDESVAVRREAVRVLEAFGPRAIGVEPLLLRQLRRSHDGQEKYLAADMLQLLGALGTRNPEAHRLLVQHLFSLETVLHVAAQAGLCRLGASVLPALKAVWAERAPYEQIRMAKVFQASGKAARAELPWLRAQLQAAKLPQLRDALEDALEAVEGK